VGFPAHLGLFGSFDGRRGFASPLEWPLRMLFLGAANGESGVNPAAFTVPNPTKAVRGLGRVPD
jgi:hypothetical protein